MNTFWLYIKQAWRLLGQNRLATVIAVAGTALAIGMIMVLVILFVANTAAFKPEIHRSDTYYVSFVKTEGKTDGRRISLSSLGLPLVESCLYPLESAELVTAFVRDTWAKGDLRTMDGTRTFNATVTATDTAYWRLFDFDFLSGAPFTGAAFKSGLPEVVLSETAARALFGSEQVTGREVKIDFVTYRVCGVVRDVSRFASVAWSEVWVPYTSLSHYDASMNGGISGSFECAILLRAGSDQAALRQELSRRADHFNAALTDIRADFLQQPYSHLERWLGAGETETSVSYYFTRMGIILLILLLVPALNLSGIILAWTRKRIPEFGLRRAYGATSRRILGQVMIENLLLTFMGGLIGFLFSYVALWLLRDWLLVTSLGQERLSIGMVNSVVFAAVFLLCLVMNLLSALLPAWKATRGTISDALNGR